MASEREGRESRFCKVNAKVRSRKPNPVSKRQLERFVQLQKASGQLFENYFEGFSASRQWPVCGIISWFLFQEKRFWQNVLEFCCV